MINKSCSRLARLVRVAQRNFGSVTTARSQNKAPARREYLQFSKARLTEFGELPQGQIPEALEYDLPFNLTTLDNGVRIATESWNSPLASLAVIVKAGTRQETLETSGVVQFIKRLHLKGGQDLNNFGGHFDIQASRETIIYTLTFPKDNVAQASTFLGKLFDANTINKESVEAERETVYNQAITNQKDQKNLTLEAIHYTSYRDHFISQPVLGIRENIANINESHVRDFISTNFVGPNIVVVGTGGVNQEGLLKATKEVFSKIPNEGPNGSASRQNSEKPYFTPSNMWMRDDEMNNLNVAVYFNAPSWTDPDFFAMKFYKEMLGEYRADKHNGFHLNAANRQYNTLHTELGDMPDITLHKAEYFPYSDAGLFGSYIYGSEVWGYQLLLLTQFITSEYASYIPANDVFRARARYFNKLLENQNSSDLAKYIAHQITFLNRRVPRSEEARRISNFDEGLLNRVATRWFYDTEISLVAWGPIGHYSINYPQQRLFRRSTLGKLGNHFYTNTKYE